MTLSHPHARPAGAKSTERARRPLEAENRARQICRQANLSENRRARFGQLCCPRLARSAESSANYAKQIGRTSPAFHRTDFVTHPARPRTDSPAFYRTKFARAPARQSDGLTFGIPSPAFPRTDSPALGRPTPIQPFPNPDMDGINRHATTSQPSFGSTTRTTRFRLNHPTSLIRQLQPILINNSTSTINWHMIVRSETFADEV